MVKSFMKQRKWRSFLLYPRFQLALIGYAAAGALIVSATLYFTNSWLVAKFVREGVALGLAPEHPYFVFMTEQQRIFTKVYAITVTVCFLIQIWGGFIISHKVAGPLHRLRRHMMAKVQGDSVGPLIFRENDYFKELVAPYNDMIGQRVQKESKKDL